MKAFNNIGIPPGTKMLRIQRQSGEPVAWIGARSGNPTPVLFKPNGFWIIWLNTNDFIHGTFLKLYDDGMIERVTVREDEPDDDVILVKPKDG